MGEVPVDGDQNPREFGEITLRATGNPVTGMLAAGLTAAGRYDKNYRIGDRHGADPNLAVASAPCPAPCEGTNAGGLWPVGKGASTPD